LLSPKMRLTQNISQINEYPCGTTEKQPVHYLAKMNSKNYVQWRVYHPASAGLCTVRIGTNDDKLYTLIPKDGSGSSDGSFPCGRESGYEGKDFIFPNISCDDCTLQFEWSVSGGKIHQCADIMITDYKGNFSISSNYYRV